MSTISLRRATGVFDETETRGLRDAYLLALHALAMTHTIDEWLKDRLADIVLNIFMAESAPDHPHLVDTCSLAARSVERYLSFQNLQPVGGDVTLH